MKYAMTAFAMHFNEFKSWIVHAAKNGSYSTNIAFRTVVQIQKNVASALIIHCNYNSSIGRNFFSGVLSKFLIDQSIFVIYNIFLCIFSLFCLRCHIQLEVSQNYVYVRYET